MPYKSVGTFDTEALYEIYDDLSAFFQAVTEQGADMHVVEPGLPDDPDGEPELWHDDYSISDGAWVEAGEFEDRYAASDAASGFPEGEAMAIFDHGDAKAKLVVRHSEG